MRNAVQYYISSYTLVSHNSSFSDAKLSPSRSGQSPARSPGQPRRGPTRAGDRPAPEASSVCQPHGCADTRTENEARTEAENQNTKLTFPEHQRVGVRRTGPSSFQWCPVTGQGATGTNWSRGSSSWTRGRTSSLW